MQVIVMTMLGILKSGVATGTSKTSVYERTGLFSYIKDPD
jgi:hypothetical protein